MSIPIRRSQISNPTVCCGVGVLEKLKAKGSFSQGLPGVLVTPVAQPTRPRRCGVLGVQRSFNDRDSISVIGQVDQKVTPSRRNSRDQD
jgi:hypothetical protein